MSGDYHCPYPLTNSDLTYLPNGTSCLHPLYPDTEFEFLGGNVGTFINVDKVGKQNEGRLYMHEYNDDGEVRYRHENSDTLQQNTYHKYVTLFDDSLRSSQGEVSTISRIMTLLNVTDSKSDVLPPYTPLSSYIAEKVASSNEGVGMVLSGYDDVYVTNTTGSIYDDESTIR